MASYSGNSAPDTPRSRRRRLFNVPERDPKKLGAFGAPQCRCTPLVLALCVGLTGLVTVGAGTCMTAFMWHDTTPRALGFALIGLGISMIGAGIGLSIYDSCVRSLMPSAPGGGGNSSSQAYANQPQSHVSTRSTSMALSAPDLLRSNQPVQSIVANVQPMPSNSIQGRRIPQQGPAPPPYDSVLEEEAHNRQGRNQYQQNYPRQSRITDSVV